jgi:predicted site-specific integrase-resolvase
MKLSEYAKTNGITYRTAWNHYKEGKISTKISPTGRILVDDIRKSKVLNQVAIYCRVSSSENKSNLDAQAERLKQYAVAKGYSIYKVIKETGSGLNDERPLLEKLLLDQSYNKLIVEHKDRLTRFGFNYINIMFLNQERTIEVVNYEDDKKDDIIQDFVSIITSFCARIYGLRRSKRKTEQFIKELDIQ